ncbi:DUF4870 domain-containing protein [Salinicoccus sp. ID82-1]|uniref:DUF4870 domain-containing protein n=1 Tax=Salinicoccus cyprini TaxID=2493691 RepID=A0A558AWS6_9STAP|nr:MULTISPECIES: DUF4870 domain-containing protein [Salinicoccus]MCG1010126.1 DUF4870 domain-containing protein [Salinicoccus sp. ID82-1]TVT28715.1 DUF4870 domain-containing protein [Salinicoccus cyprini]
MYGQNTQLFDKALVMVSFIVSAFTAVVGPLLIWVLKKDDDPVTAEALRNVANFGISYTIYMFIAWLSSFILIGLIIGPIITVLFYVFLIVGAIRANDGIMYKPPFTLDIIK